MADVVPVPDAASQARQREAGLVGWRNLDAEQAVLAACLIDPAIFPEARALVRPGDFWRDKNSWIWGAMERLQAQGKPVNQLTVHYEIHRAGRLEALGRGYLSLLIAEMPTSVDWRSYAGVMQDLARERNGEKPRPTNTGYRGVYLPGA